jgi:hypothetical protein
MVHGKILNILQITGVIFLIASLFKSAGLLVLVPLSLAVLGNFGLMGLSVSGSTLQPPLSPQWRWESALIAPFILSTVFGRNWPELR